MVVGRDQEAALSRLAPQLDAALLDEESSVQGLTWARTESVIGELWGHNGADPGIRSHMQFDPENGKGIIVFANRAARLTPIFERLLEEMSASDH